MISIKSVIICAFLIAVSSMMETESKSLSRKDTTLKLKSGRRNFIDENSGKMENNVEASMFVKEYHQTVLAKSYEEADWQCAQNGAILAPLKTSNQMTAFCKEFSTAYAGFWRIGLKFDEEGKGEWSDGVLYDADKHIKLGQDLPCGSDVCDVLVRCTKESVDSDQMWVGFKWRKADKIAAQIICYKPQPNKPATELAPLKTRDQINAFCGVLPRNGGLWKLELHVNEAGEMRWSDGVIYDENKHVKIEKLCSSNCNFLLLCSRRRWMAFSSRKTTKFAMIN